MALTSLDETHILAVLENVLDGASLTRMSPSAVPYTPLTLPPILLF